MLEIKTGFKILILVVYKNVIKPRKQVTEESNSVLVTYPI